MNARNMTGMDIAQVRSLSRQLRTEAAEIESVLAAMTAELHALPWKGNDRERFLREWDSTHVRALRRVVGSLESASSESNEYARRQEIASGGTSGGGW